MLGLSWAATKVLHRAKNGPNPKVVSEADPASRIDCSTTYPVYGLSRAREHGNSIRVAPEATPGELTVRTLGTSIGLHGEVEPQDGLRPYSSEAALSALLSR